MATQSRHVLRLGGVVSGIAGGGSGAPWLKGVSSRTSGCLKVPPLLLIFQIDSFYNARYFYMGSYLSLLIPGECTERGESYA